MDKIEKEDLYCILYISTMKRHHTKEEIQGMLKLFQENNKKNNISGLMLYYEKNVIQYIEGNKEDLYRLYNNIENDKRHYHVIKIIDKEINKRNFIDWNLGYKELTYNEFIKFSLNNLEFIDNKKIFIFFKQFLDSFTYK